MLGRVLAPHVCENMAVDIRNNKSKSVELTFQTLRLAMLGKWATTHEISLGKNCSWTGLGLLPGSI